MVTRGELSVLSRGVYLAGAAELTPTARNWAAVLATDGVLGLTTAAHLWDVEVADDPEIHVFVPAEKRLRPLPGVRLHRFDLPRNAIRQRSGLDVCARHWTVLDLLGWLPFRDASVLADRALQRRWITVADVQRRLDRYPHRNGNPQLRRLQQQLGDGAAAKSERLLHRILRQAGLTGWVPNLEIRVDGVLSCVLDVAFPEAALAIEIDGMAYHVDVARFRRDRAKQNDLVALGWTVLRFTWADLVERPDYVIEVIRQQLS